MNTPAHICPNCGNALPQQIATVTGRMLEAAFVIANHVRRTGVGPSYTEIAAAMGVRSKGVVNSFVNALVERGWLHHEKNRVRSLNLTPAAWGEISRLEVLTSAA